MKSFGGGRLVLSHASNLEKKQLRRWVREPVDFSIVMDNIKTGGQSTMRVGLNRRFYQVK